HGAVALEQSSGEPAPDVRLPARDVRILGHSGYGASGVPRSARIQPLDQAADPSVLRSVLYLRLRRWSVGGGALAFCCAHPADPLRLHRRCRPVAPLGARSVSGGDRPRISALVTRCRESFLLDRSVGGETLVSASIFALRARRALRPAN